MQPVSSFFGAASCVSLNETAALIYLCVKDTGYGSKAARGHACLREAKQLGGMLVFEKQRTAELLCYK